MGDIIKKWQKPGDTYSIVCELYEYPEDPIESEEYITTFVLGHKRYNLGNKTPIDFSAHSSWEGVMSAIKREYKDMICAVPVYMYDHSGISLSTAPFTCPWDSGQIGYALIRKSSLKKWGLKDQSIEDLCKIIDNDVFKYSLYLNGFIYIVSLIEHTTCETCGQTVTSIVDTSIIDSGIDSITKDIFGQEYTYIFDHIVIGG